MVKVVSGKAWVSIALATCATTYGLWKYSHRPRKPQADFIDESIEGPGNWLAIDSYTSGDQLSRWEKMMGSLRSRTLDLRHGAAFLVTDSIYSMFGFPGAMVIFLED